MNHGLSTNKVIQISWAAAGAEFPEAGVLSGYTETEYLHMKKQKQNKKHPENLWGLRRWHSG